MGRIAGVSDISSQSSFGRSRVTVEFNDQTDLNVAASDARDSIGRILNQLPDDVDEPRIVKADANADPVMRIGVTSKTMPIEQLTDLVENTVSDRLIAAHGVADVSVYGARDRIFRVDVDQMALASRGLTLADVRDALATVAFDSPAGSLTAANQSLVVRTTATVNTPEAFGALMLDPYTRLSDVATVTLGPDLGSSILRSNGENGLGIGIIRQAQSNTLDISRSIHAIVADLATTLPPGVSIFITGDDALFITSAIHEVLRTLALSVVIVVAIIYLFLRDWRATLIPAADDPGGADRHDRRDLPDGLLDQHPDAARAGAGDRARRRRRDRRAREHRAPPRPRHGPARGGGARHAAGLLRRRRDHRDARRGLRAAVVPARPDRRALPRVRHHAGARGDDLGARRAVALPDARLAHARRRRGGACTVRRARRPLRRVARGRPTTACCTRRSTRRCSW